MGSNMNKKIRLRKKTVLIALSFTAVCAASFVLILLVFTTIMENQIAAGAQKAIESLADAYASDDTYAMEEGSTESETYFGQTASSPLMSALFEDESETEEAVKTEETAVETEADSDTYGFDDTYYYAQSFLIDRNMKPAMFITPSERALAVWYASHRKTNGQVQKTSVEGRTFYVAETEDRFYSTDGTYRWLLYVDVTDQQHLINYVNRIEIIIMAICSALAAYLGIRLGISIEREQDRQKKVFENASHELKTPLMSIQGYAEGIASGVISDTKEASRIIMSETDKMESLVEEILSLSRLESNSVRFSPEMVSIAGMVNDCLVSMEYVIEKRGLSVRLNLDEAKVEADPALFERALTNLISNAVKYAKSEIELSCSRTHLIVRNDGCRLSKDEIAHIFDRFYIGPNGSTGIGLALTQEIVRQHGWRIHAGNYEKGVQFIITF